MSSQYSFQFYFSISASLRSDWPFCSARMRCHLLQKFRRPVRNFHTRFHIFEAHLHIFSTRLIFPKPACYRPLNVVPRPEIFIQRVWPRQLYLVKIYQPLCFLKFLYSSQPLAFGDGLWLHMV